MKTLCICVCFDSYTCFAFSLCRWHIWSFCWWWWLEGKFLQQVIREAIIIRQMRTKHSASWLESSDILFAIHMMQISCNKKINFFQQLFVVFKNPILQFLFFSFVLCLEIFIISIIKLPVHILHFLKFQI